MSQRKARYNYVSKHRVANPIFHKSASPQPQPLPSGAAAAAEMWPVGAVITPETLESSRSLQMFESKQLPPTPLVSPMDGIPSPDVKDQASAKPRPFRPSIRYHSSADAYSMGRLPVEPPWTKNIIITPTPETTPPVTPGSPRSPIDQRSDSIESSSDRHRTSSLSEKDVMSSGEESPSSTKGPAKLKKKSHLAWYRFGKPGSQEKHPTTS